MFIFQKIALFICVVINLSFLFYYKYFIFFLEIFGLKSNFTNEFLDGIVLPIGISFFTFQGLSYVIDVFRKDVEASFNPIHIGLYVSLFPQLIAGPIVKYHDVYQEIQNRKILFDEFILGIKRFIIGFAKKVIIANNFAIVSDSVFDSNLSDISSLNAWIGIICYSLQIYYDFSAYSDMAIGLGKMMGFHFKENFNFPYQAKSIREFWQKWHISLSTWFKEYVYIPLGGNRKKEYRVLFNLLIVFILTGIWHGASYNFIIWGLIHGTFIILERIIPYKLNKKYNFLAHIYVLFIVMIAWVFFRIETLEGSFIFLNKLFCFNSIGETYSLHFISPFFVSLFIIGIFYSIDYTNKSLYILKIKEKLGNNFILFSYLLLFGFSLLELSSLAYNPFIYFRF